MNRDEEEEPRRPSRKELKARIRQLEATLADTTYEVTLDLPSLDGAPVLRDVLLVREGQYVQMSVRGVVTDKGQTTYRHVVMRCRVRRTG